MGKREIMLHTNNEDTMTQHKGRGRKGSWEPVAKSYGKQVGKSGHYYHQNVVLPGVKQLLEQTPPQSVLDLACGQGVLARQLPPKTRYVGMDISPSLIKQAQGQSRNKLHRFEVGDITIPLKLDTTFDTITCVLALQNVADPAPVFHNVAGYLSDGGRFIFVINHPCFRIPRQSGWGVDDKKKAQYRRIERYMSKLEVPIQANPSKGEKSAQTWSYHHPLSHYVTSLHEAGLQVQQLEEWCSDKKSEGRSAKMEDRARAEIPLFMAIVAVKA